MNNQDYKILIVDDTALVIDVIKEALLKKQYQIAIATSGEKALSKLDLINPDLILLDVLMPGIDGYETCQQIKALPQFVQTPIIFISALNEAFDKVKAFECGAVDYLTKPINFEELGARVHAHLQNAVLKKQLIQINHHLEHQVEERTFEIQKQNSKLKKINRELNKQQKKLEDGKKTIELIIEGANVGTFERYVSKDKVIRNQMAAKMIGYSLDELGDNNDLWLSLIHPDDVPQTNYACALDNNTEWQESFDICYRIKHRLGHWVWLRCRGKITAYDDEGRPEIISGVFMDVTKEKEAELLLKKSEENFRLLSDSSNEGIIIHKNGIVFNINNYIMRLIGCNSVDDLIGKPLPLEFVDPESLPMLKLNIENEFTGTIEIGVILPDGKHIDMELETSEIIYSNQKMRLALLRDISQNKQANLISKAQLNILDNYSETTTEQLLIKIIDEAEKITRSKIGFFHFVQPDQEALSLQVWSTSTGKTYCKLPDNKMHYPISKAGIWADCLRERRPIIHNDYKNCTNKKGLPEGHANLIREMVTPIFRHDKVVAIAGVGNKSNPYDAKNLELFGKLMDDCWDVVQQKIHETEIKKLSVAVEQSANTIVITDLDGNIEYTNTKFSQITGYSSEEAKGQNPRILNSGYQPKEYYDQMWKTISSGQSWKGEFHNKNKKGDLYWEKVLITPIKNDAGDIVNFLAIKEDITAQKEAEDELERINERFLILERILHYSYKTTNDLLNFALDNIIAYTNSSIGFVYYYNENNNLFVLNNWSDKVKLSYQSKSNSLLEIDSLNMAVSDKKPVIINDSNTQYPFLNDHCIEKSHYHSLSIPILSNNAVVAVVWLGSETAYYSEFVARQMSLLLEATWILVEKQKMKDNTD